MFNIGRVWILCSKPIFHRTWVSCALNSSRFLLLKTINVGMADAVMCNLCASIGCTVDYLPNLSGQNLVWNITNHKIIMKTKRKSLYNVVQMKCRLLFTHNKDNSAVQTLGEFTDWIYHMDYYNKVNCLLPFA